MQTRSRAREIPGMDDAPEPQLNGADQVPPHERSTQGNDDTIDARGLLALIHDASTRAAAQAMAQFAAQHPINPPPPSPRRSRELSSAPRRRSRGRRSPFSTAILAEALPAGVKVSNLSEYDGTGDPQEHLDKFYAKIDWYDLSDAAYCKVFRTTLSKRALAWFNQLPAGTISSLEQLNSTFFAPLFHEQEGSKNGSFLIYYTSKGERTAERLHAKRQPPHSRGYRRDFGRPSRRGFRQCKESPGSRSQENNWQTPNQIHNINSDKQGEIAFGEQDLDPMRNQNNDALVISATLSNFWVKKVLVDSGSSADIIFYDAYVQLGVDNAQLRKVNTPLTGFSGEMIEPLGEVTLPLSLVPYLGWSGRSRGRDEEEEMGLEIKDAPEEPFGKICGERRVEAIEELKVINLSEDDEKTTKIGTKMRPSTEEHLIQFLKKNKEVFAWTMTDLHGISPDVITHKLSVNPSAKPYPEWLANVVLVPKPNGKWRLCIDFTDLNKACPKDPFPLPRIDILVDSTSGCEMLSFLDAYQGYNQIPLAPEDQEKASFVTDQGVFCYNVMPFGLKNAGATYQRLVNHMFQNQIGRNMEVYIDDMLVKSEKEQDHIKDLEECFQILTTFGMKLNPAKCTFGVRGGRFLGYMISERGIEANPEKINENEIQSE
ncbi:UNVERIFIED_CONTAM: Transposon Ty3-G Gag-Pol polyprotein [Sesamum calycinum]|uniref:Transposon Ty3-G Gag-Pol polyprotein n=1 Tax=Sesamum calycinum TaxID=2727403 RepID=A0AAW2S9N4_9LAMI